jgi:hypothetical protein
MAGAIRPDLTSNEVYMSDLKWKSVSQLKVSKASEEKYIGELNGKLNNAKIRLEWINKYLYQKTPVELTISEVEARLGHKIIIREY